MTKPKHILIEGETEMKVLNLYAGIGGNRKLWEGVKVTAIENNPKYAKIYQDSFPKDKVIIADAHQFLIEHYKEFDFIWSSPPCPTHSRFRKYTNGCRFKDVYPDMSLWQEIIFLQHHFEGKWVVENVVAYYDFIPPQRSGRHYFWSNFPITDKKMPVEIPNTKYKTQKIAKAEYFNNAPEQAIRNAVNPQLGKHIMDCAYNNAQHLLLSFDVNTMKNEVK